MEILLTIIHLAACFILIVIVLLQKGKGADLAGAFGGGGSQTTMGVRSATQMIHRLTIAAAVFFMITSYTLGLLGSGGGGLVQAVQREAERTQSTQPAGEEKTTTPAQEEEQTQDDASGQDATDETGDAEDPEAGNTPSGDTEESSSGGNN
ncbi:MAG TPA: preprotein translocase subunit SecG [Acidobacteriota bacterium]|nr:preprotein translocase subunit SecG [Acidobacteriota bacterium]